MRKLAKARRVLVSALAFQVTVSLTAVTSGLAAAPANGQSGADPSKLAAVDTPLIDKAGKQQPAPADNKPAEAQAPAATPGQGETPPAPSESSSSTKAWIYGGLGAAAVVGIVAVAASGGGGSSSGGGTSSGAPAATPPSDTSNSSCNCRCEAQSGKWSCPSTPYFYDSSGECHESLTINTNPRSPVADNPSAPHVCADLSGQWQGMIDLTGVPSQSVTATITQDGGKIEIQTSSPFSYGQVFIGDIGPDCNILNYEQKTGQDWSTHEGPANANSINLYDFVDISCHGYTRYDRLFLTR